MSYANWYVAFQPTMLVMHSLAGTQEPKELPFTSTDVLQTHDSVDEQLDADQDHQTGQFVVHSTMIQLVLLVRCSRAIGTTSRQEVA